MNFKSCLKLARLSLVISISPWHVCHLCSFSFTISSLCQVKGGLNIIGSRELEFCVNLITRGFYMEVSVSVAFNVMLCSIHVMLFHNVKVIN